MLFEFLIPILVDPGQFAKGMFVSPPWGFTNVLFTKFRPCEMWGVGKGKWGGTWYGTSAPPEKHFTKGTFVRVSQTCLGANVPSGLVPSTFIFWPICGHSWGLVYGEGGVPGTVCTTWEALHMFFTERCPSGGTEHVSFELFLGILRGPGEGDGAPLVRYLCKTQKSLHGRHVWETLILRNFDEFGGFRTGGPERHPCNWQLAHGKPPCQSRANKRPMTATIECVTKPPRYAGATETMTPPIHEIRKVHYPEGRN